MGILYFAMAVSSFASVAHSYSFTTVFTVSESGMHFPCTNGFFEEQMIHARDILALNYYDGFADEPKGLYLSSPNKRICLIRGLKAKEVDHILSAIRTRFPRLEQQPPTPKYADRVPDVIASNLKAAN